MNHNKLFTTAILIAFASQLVACSPYKPDHPQVRESFKERRAPRDNMLAASGTVIEQKTSNFQPVNPTTTKVVDTQSSPTAGATLPPSVTNIIQQPGSAVPSSSGDSSTPSAPSGNILNRLMNKFSAFIPNTNNTQQVAKRAVAQNDIEQGSTSAGYSYYDMAQEVLPAAPVMQVAQARIHTISSDFGYLTTPDNGSRRFAIINSAQAQDAPPVAPAVPTIPTAPAAPPAVATTPAVTTPPAPPSAPVVPMVQAPVAGSAALAPQAPELPKVNANSVPVAAPKPVMTQPMEMPKAPSIPTNEQIKNSAPHSHEPELNEIPARPEHKAPEAVKAPEVHQEIEAPVKKAPAKKVVKKHHHKKVAAPMMESGDPYAEKPIPADVSTQINGDEKVTGYLK